MRLLVILIVLVLLAVLVVRLIQAVMDRSPARPGRLERYARWETHTESAGGVTTVLVRRVAHGPDGPVEFGRQVIAEIADREPDWDRLYLEAMAQARSRVTTLEIESGD